MWRRHLQLWGGAVVVGLVVGIAPSLLRSAPNFAGEAKSRLAVQTVPEEKPTPEDQDWAARASSIGEGSIGVTASFGFCHNGGGTNCVVDGDTLWIQGQKVRVADIDAPETHDYRCPKEKALGDRATQRLIQLVNSGPVALQPIDRDEDRYGRKLRIVMVNGTSVGDTLVGEGLARQYEGGRRSWC
jgi:endonuclease YncB( thermonuclease family)